MQQLLARMLHKSNAKAAAKAVDKMIEDVETCVLAEESMGQTDADDSQV
jgi:predicted DNA-binding protein